MIKRANTYGIGDDIVQVALQLGMDNYALKLVQGMKTVSSYKSGGFVKEAKNREEKSNHQKRVRKIERDMARRLAKDGHTVYLLPESKLPGVRNPDAIVDGKVFEFKLARNIKKAEMRVLQGWKQAKGVVLTISEKIDMHRLYGKLKNNETKGIIWILYKNELLQWNF